MDSLGRLLLRFLLVPLGYFVAVVIGTLVIVFGSWKLGVPRADPDAQPFALFGFVFAAPVLLVMLLSVMWLPAAIGMLILGNLRAPLLDIPRRQRRGLGLDRMESVRLYRREPHPAQ